ncbi:hypothetical protein HUN41_00100 [Streptomyces phage Coruscant]|uniref:Uncharacterized protein n=1 Tax=Streptomyces phage Coruscant TaxID=2739834 RepID=A0A7G4AW39_9CAUD|nr:hypothetical protein PP454_gp188 [Streptomyces phage Coruscant]QMP84229.1 hypothetical protein HUN41_00100 [Streptomyces phage Coruscant]
MNYEEIIDGYNELLEKCYNLIKKDDGRLMGSDYWLRAAIMETDITLEFRNEGIYCYGNCYTTQTMDFESFGFLISLKEIKGE